MNYSQLPDEVLPLTRSWSAMQLAIWCDIYTMHRNGCTYYRTNDQLAERFGTDARTIRRVIHELIRVGAVTSYQETNRRLLTTVELDGWVVQGAPRRPKKKEGGPAGPGTADPGATWSAREGHSVREGGPAGPQRGGHVALQIEREIESIEDNGINNKGREQKSTRRKPKEREYHDVVMPFDSDTFSAAWREWLDYKWAQHRFAYKRKQDEQTALHHLQKNSNGNEQLAIHIIAASIANGWQGLFASSPKKSNMGAGSRSGGYFHSSGKYEHPADVLKDRDIWG